MDDYISKPINPDTFADKLMDWLARTPPVADAPSAAPAEEGAEEGDLVDERPLSSLAAHVPAEAIRSLLANWLNTTKEGVARAGALAEAGDGAGVERELHRLAGTAGTFGAHRLGEEARRLEEACARAGLETVRGQIPAFQDLARRTLDGYRARFGGG